MYKMGNIATMIIKLAIFPEKKNDKATQIPDIHLGLKKIWDYLVKGGLKGGGGGGGGINVNNYITPF